MRTPPLPYADYDPSRCLNCGRELNTGDQFCGTCGQRNRTHKRSLLEWVSEGLSTFLHLEGRTWNTLRDLPVPGRLVRNYLDGKRARYIHPLRLLLLSSLLSLGVGSALDTPSDDDTTATASETKLPAPDDADALAWLTDTTATAVTAVADDIESSGTTLRINPDGIFIDEKDDDDDDDDDSASGASLLAQHPIAERMRDVDVTRAEVIMHDLLERDLSALQDSDTLLSADARQLATQLLRRYPEPRDSLNIGIGGADVQFAPRQLAALSPRALANESGLTHPLGRLVVRKAMSLYQEGQDNLNEHLVQNLTWGILTFVPLLALGYFALYHRRLPYYSQHLALVAVTASVGLLLVTVAALIGRVMAQGIVEIVCVTTFGAYAFTTEMRVYAYPWYKTLLKTLALTLYGSIAFGIATLLWLLLSVLLF